MSEVYTTLDIDQFATNGTGVPPRSESLEECGFFSIAVAVSSGKNSLLHDRVWIDNCADYYYKKWNGLNTRSNPYGMSIDEMGAMIVALGNHWQTTNPDKISAWIASGYPVFCTVNESSVKWVGHGSPYPWDTQGLSHIVTITGMQGNHYLVRDTANEILEGPYLYDMSINYACVFVPTWLARPNGDNPPVLAPVPPTSNPHIRTQFITRWHNASGINSGIGTSAYEMKLHGHDFGMPTSEEYEAIDYNGNMVIMRDFASSHAEWFKGRCRWFSPNGEIK